MKENANRLFLIILMVCLTLSIIGCASAPPLPSATSIIPPSSDVPSELAELSGIWEGKLGAGYDSIIIFESIDSQKAGIIFSWTGNTPNYLYIEGEVLPGPTITWKSYNWPGDYGNKLGCPCTLTFTFDKDQKMLVGFLEYDLYKLKDRLELKRSETGNALLQRAINNTNNKPSYYLNLVYFYYLQKEEYRKAEEILKEGLTTTPNDTDLNFALAHVYEKSSRLDDMVRQLKKTLALDPDHTDALNYLGYYYADREINLNEAERLINKALTLKPDNPYFRDSLGWVYFKQGRHGDSLREIKKAMDIAKYDPHMYEHLGDIYLKMGREEDAKEAWVTSLKYIDREKTLKERVQKKVQDYN